MYCDMIQRLDCILFAIKFKFSKQLLKVDRSENIEVVQIKATKIQSVVDAFS